MRSISINLYKYDELPTEIAKDVAREWWSNLECQEPSFLNDHNKSVKAALKFLGSYSYGRSDFDKLCSTALEMKYKGECLWTGYIDDLTAIDCIVKACEKVDDIDMIKYSFKCYMAEEYSKQLDESLKVENVEEVIRINDYEFTADGKIYR